eukprot:1313936-Rhodomonas_salina.1
MQRVADGDEVSFLEVRPVRLLVLPYALSGSVVLVSYAPAMRYPVLKSAVLPERGCIALRTPCSLSGTDAGYAATRHCGPDRAGRSAATLQRVCACGAVCAILKIAVRPNRIEFKA